MRERERNGECVGVSVTFVFWLLFVSFFFL